MRKLQISIDIEDIRAEILYHTIDDHEVKTLIIDFGKECRMLSTACGYKKIRYAANHYISPPLWEYNLEHFDKYLEKIYGFLRIDKEEIAMLVTGIDMDNVVYRYLNYGELKVCSLITAGAKSNALRMGVDKAQVEDFEYHSSIPGTINIILFTNANLSDGAMAMAIINITEAKTGALQDLNVPSTYTPELLATGTGTDGVTVVSGEGVPINSTSGHLKIGELIGRTVREAVIKALNLNREIVRKSDTDF